MKKFQNIKEVLFKVSYVSIMSILVLNMTMIGTLINASTVSAEFACEFDIDGDYVCDEVDNCPMVANPGQEDADSNGVGDACESPCTDVDDDGFCDDVDCDDNNSAVYPGASENCSDSIDNNCNGLVDCDDATCAASCAIPPISFCFLNNDYDTDHDGVCNKSDNCVIVSNPNQADEDGDGVGDACTDEDQDSYSINEDCDDNNDAVYPGAPEIYGDGIDQDCDGSDEYCGDDQINGTEECDGTPDCTSDCTLDTSCNGAAPVAEVCNSIDDNCDGVIDEDFDELGDVCTVGVGACSADGTLVCNPMGDGTVCSAVPGTPVDEVCDDGIDNDCDGEVDENCTVACAYDEDCGDGEICDNGLCSEETMDCLDSDGDGYGLGVDCKGTDCNDDNPNAWRTGCLYVDLDGDGYHGTNFPDKCSDEGYPEKQRTCYGDLPSNGHSDSTKGEDCNDDDETVTTECNDVVCEPGMVELSNPSFEKPNFNNSNGWKIFKSSKVYWNVDWVYPSEKTPKLELQNHVHSTWKASDGKNYAELDSDGRRDRQASVIIGQDVDTFEGAEYILSFDFSPRPGTNEENNVLEVYVGGELKGTFSADGSANNGTVWDNKQITFLADSDLTEIAFKDAGTPDTLGTFIDNVSLELLDCHEEYCGDGIINQDSEECDDGNNVDGDLCSSDCMIEYCGDGVVNQEWEECDGGDDCNDKCQLKDDDTCSDLVLARVNVDEVNNFEDADSNMTSDIYLGSDWYHIPAGTWFSLYWVGDTDSDIAGYEDVPGLAVQRTDNNEVRVVMYGSHPSKDKEHIHGNVEFYNASVLDQRSDKSNDKPKNNRLENGFDANGVGQYNAGNDEVWFEDGNTKQSFFWLTTTTADDGYYTSWAIDNSCQESVCGYKYNYDTEEGIEGWNISLKEKQGCRKGAEWADYVVSSDQNGTTVNPDRSNTDNALGVAQDDDTINFYSLGMGGNIVLGFDNVIYNGDGPDLRIYETSFGSPDCETYPEYVQVFASQDGDNWTELGTQCQDGDLGFDLGELQWASYVKLVDASLNEGDGFDVDGVRALHCYSYETIDEVQTDENGHYCFYDLEDGDYRVEEETREEEGWHYHDYYYQDIAYNSGDENNVDFYNSYEEVCDNTIEGRKINYFTESGIEGWVIDLADSEGNVFATTSTDSEGHYKFDNLCDGTYQVSEKQEFGWMQVKPQDEGGQDYYVVDVPTRKMQATGFRIAMQEGPYLPYYNFVNKPMICGHKYDSGNDSIGVEGWGMSLDQTSDMLCATVYDGGTDSCYSDLFIATTTTNSEGEYCFDVNATGSYTVTEEERDDWVADGEVSVQDEFDGTAPLFVDFRNHQIEDKVFCGDGFVNQDSEECDDGNDVDNDKCSNTCENVYHSSGGGGTYYRYNNNPTPTPTEETPVVLGEEGAPFLVIVVDPELATANPGDENVKFSITVSNKGEIAAINTSLDVVLPEGLSYNDPAVSGTWALGDIETGDEVNVDIYVDVAEDADSQTYSIAASAKADNNDSVSAPAGVNVEQPIVLAETGFNLSEFLILLFALFASTGSLMYLKRETE